MDSKHDVPGSAGSSPWRQPIVWLVVALVAAAVAGSVVMLIVAGDGASDAIPDQVQRTAGAQVGDLGPDAAAQQRQLSAIVRIDAKRGVVQAVPVTGTFDRGAPLQLALHHPVRQADDRMLELQPSDTGWETRARIDGSHDWNLQLAPGDGRWRLRGRLPKAQLAARVAPALQAP